MVRVLLLLLPRQEGLLQRREEHLSLFLVISGKYVDTEHDVRSAELFRRTEAGSIELQCLIHQGGCKMGGEGERQTHRSGELSSIETRAQDPDWYLEAGPGDRLHCLPRLRRLEVMHQLGDIVRKAVGR